MRLHPAMKNGERNVVPFRSATMSTQIVAQVREALFAKELRPGDFLGTEKDHARLRELIGDAERRIDDVPAFTRSSREFHLAVAEASHNRVLVVQLVSLQHVSWPAHNPTLTPSVARRILDAHVELAARIEMRDAAGARRLMDDHVKMIAARRVAEHRDKREASRACC